MLVFRKYRSNLETGKFPGPLRFARVSTADLTQFKASSFAPFMDSKMAGMREASAFVSSRQATVAASFPWPSGPTFLRTVMGPA
jgi:hypothetical protein